MAGNILLVGAIDFGTTYSGYAFSFKSTPNTILMNKNWGAEQSCLSYKAPTCVMTKPDGSFDSFGYAAQTNYSDYGSGDGYEFYHEFKMMLNREKISLSSEITSEKDHSRRAVDIFAMALTYLFDHMMEAINKQVASPPDPSDIRLVVTIPAIWKDEAKAFMREAATKAGIISEANSRNLVLSLEPEAASVFCRTPELNSLGSNRKIRSGDKMLVLDAGGGTVDIIVHEIQFDGKVKEIAPPSGGPWGGTTVNKNFADLLKRCFGSTSIENFKNQNSQEWIQLMAAFETTKRLFNPKNESMLKVTLGFKFCMQHFMDKNKPPEEVLQHVEGVSFNNGYLCLDSYVAYELFSPSVTEIVNHINKLLESLDHVDYILLVGGYGQCEVLQDACKTHFGDKVQLLIPHEAQIAILNGAVLFGHDPSQIGSRKARFTYGTGCRNSFKKGVHDDAKKVTDKDGEEKCDDCFSVFITKDEDVKTGEKRTFTFHPSLKNQTMAYIGVYKVDETKVMYIDEPGVTKLGGVILDSQRGPLGNEIEIQVTVGHTEMMIESRDKSKGADFPINTNVDFI